MAEIKHFTHDDGTFSEYGSAPNSRLLVTAAAGLNSTSHGVEKNRTGSAGDGSVAVNLGGATTEIRCGFYFDLNTIAITPTSNARLVYFKGGGGGENFFIDLRDEGGGDFIRVITTDDNSNEISTETSGGGLPGGEMTIEIVWTKASGAAANDGVCEILINGVQAAITSNIDFFNSFDGLAHALSSFFLDTGGWTGSGTLYYDEIIIRDDTTPIYPPVTAFRFLGFDADNENLYASGLKDDATLQLFDYDLPTLTEGGTASFGSGTDAELDALTRGIFPVVKPMADKVLYLRGRDGNDVQVQYNDQNGTLGWVDIGPGTATWGTAKYAAGLLTAPTYTDDTIAVFSDDDIYRTRFGTEIWVQMGDAGEGLRAGARHIGNRFNEILVGGTAAGTIEWSNNFGVTFGDVSGTILGTVNAFEVSL